MCASSERKIGINGHIASYTAVDVRVLFPVEELGVWDVWLRVKII